MKSLKSARLVFASLAVYTWMGTVQIGALSANQELPKNLIDQIHKEEPGSEVVASIQGDFNGDGQLDYAFILREPTGWKVKAYHTQKSGYASFNLEDFGTDPASPTSFKLEQFRLILLKKGAILNINGRPVPRATHDYDAIELLKIDDPGTAGFYDWTPVPNAKSEPIRKNGSYTLSGFGGLGNE